MKKDNGHKVTWQDVKEWSAIFDLTFRKMHQKFYPHFCGLEEDIRQEMMIELIHSIKRIKNGEIRSERNYVITALKFKCYKIAKKLITYDRSTIYLSDLVKNWHGEIEWDNLILGTNMFDIEQIISYITEEDDRYIFMCILKMDGYRRAILKEKLGISWEELYQKEEDLKEKLVETIKMIMGE